MQEEPTSFRIEDPGVRALFTEAARFQAWLDVEAALALAQADLGIIPASAAEEITRKAHLSYIDLEAVHAGLARTGHPLVPLIWELDRVCEACRLTIYETRCQLYLTDSRHNSVL